MLDQMNVFLNFILPLLLLALGFLAGKAAETSHYRSIRRREKRLLHIPALTTKKLQTRRRVRSAALAVGSVVVSVDYYKRFLAALRNIFGGELLSYSSLIDRGRREALLRMKESCPGADLYLNCRIETASIFKGAAKATGSVEILAYATAITFQK